MRIAVAHSYYRTAGGEDSYVGTQAKLLAKEHDVCVVSRNNVDLSGGVQAATRAAFSLGARRSVSDALMKFRPDVIHVHNIYPSLGPVVHQTARKLRVPLVMTVNNFRLRCPNGLMFTDGQICRRCCTGRYYNAVFHPCFPSKTQSAGYAVALWVHRFVNKLENSVDAFIAPSQFMQRKLAEWGIDPSRIRMVRYVARSVAPGPQIESGFGAYLGRLSEEKGVDVLLEALRAAGNPPFRIAGDGPARGELKSLADQLGLSNTEFVGFLESEDVDHLLRSARFLVFPSVWEENNPLAAYEAMSAGRPILVSDKGGLPELARDGRGIIFPSGNVQGLAAALRRLMAADRLCASMGHRALEFAKAELDEQRHARSLTEIYEELVSRPETRG